jgi:dephospho-CoA kinase
MTYIVGLTGGIGSGKSAAAQVFGELGIAVIDTDAIAHVLTGTGGAAMAPIRATFGAAYLNPEGALARERMRDLVFADAAKKRQLESILHPMIRTQTSELVQAARGPYVILMVPLLIESNDYRQRCQRILVVDCAEELQLARVTARSGLTAAQVRAIMANQATRGVRLGAADDVIDNNLDLAQLRLQVETLHARYLQLAAAGG